MNLIPLTVIDLDKDSLKVAGQKLSRLDGLVDELSPEINNTFYNSSYFTFKIYSLIKLIGLYSICKTYTYLRSKCLRGRSRNCYQNITNCLTLNICKNSETTDISIELEDKVSCLGISPSKSSNSNKIASLRCSSRITKLKDKI